MNGWRNVQVRGFAWLLTVLVVAGYVNAQTADEGTHKSDPVDAEFVLPDQADFDMDDRDQRRDYTRQKNEANDRRRGVEKNAEGVVEGTADFNAGRSDLNRYLTGLVIPEMTLTDDQSLYNLADRREDLLKLVRDAANGSPVRDFLLNEALLPSFSRIAQDEAYHPAVRLNAVLIVGALNEREGSRGGQPPRPLEAATQLLSQIAGNDAQPGFLRIGALSGLLRHASLDGQLWNATSGSSKLLSDSVRNSLVDLSCGMVDSVAETDFSSLDDESYWITRQAVQLLGALTMPGDGGKVVICLKKLIENDQTPELLMADAIAAFGSIRFSDPAQAEAGRMAALIAKRLSQVLRADAQAIDDYLYAVKEKKMIDEKTVAGEKQSASGGSDEGGDDFGSTSGGGAGKKGAGGAGGQVATKNLAIKFPNYMVNDIRQRAKAMTYVCRKALDGNPPRRRNETKPAENLKKAADETTQAAIAKLVTVLDNLMDRTDLKSSSGIGDIGQLGQSDVHEQLKSALEKGSGDIDRVVESLEPKIGS